MPEGPEIAKSADYLKKSLLVNSTNARPRLVNVIQLGNKFPSVNIEELRPCLDQPLLDITYKGKELYIILSDGQNGIKVVRGHLGMKGKWFTERYDSNQPLDQSKYKNIHYRLDFSYTPDSHTPEIMIFYQNERFGQFEILPSQAAFDRAHNSLAPSFLGPYQITLEEWTRRWSSIRGTRYIRDILMDQTILCSGVGNYCAIELFYELGYHPKIRIKHLQGNDVIRLYHALQNMMNNFFIGVRSKVIYKKQICPLGHKILYEKMFSRPMYWVPEIQVLGSA